MHLSHQPDKTPHPSVQTWSRGPIFPAVIKRVEEYDAYPFEIKPGSFNSIPGCSAFEERRDFYGRPLDERLVSTHWELIYPGREPEAFATHEAAETFARLLNVQARNPVRVLAAPSIKSDDGVMFV